MKIFKRILKLLLVILIIGFCIPQELKIPVQGASKNSYHPKSFWYYPWGKSVTHKGVDIFAKKGTIINSATKGIILYRGKIPVGGNVILVLGPKWRLHYYAHLDKIKDTKNRFINQSTSIGTVGDSGNAKGKQAHLHYSIFSLVPYPWRIDNSQHGWRKMFYLNPITYFESE